MVTHYFSCSGQTSRDLTKNVLGAGYAELVFLHPVEYVGRVVHSGASGA
jgi:hypothetical protein